LRTTSGRGLIARQTAVPQNWAFRERVAMPDVAFDRRIRGSHTAIVGAVGGALLLPCWRKLQRAIGRKQNSSSATAPHEYDRGFTVCTADDRLAARALRYNHAGAKSLSALRRRGVVGYGAHTGSVSWTVAQVLVGRGDGNLCGPVSRGCWRRCSSLPQSARA